MTTFDMNSLAGFAHINRRRQYRSALLHEWAGYLHACLTSPIPLVVQDQMARKADA